MKKDSYQISLDYSPFGKVILIYPNNIMLTLSISFASLNFAILEYLTLTYLCGLPLLFCPNTRICILPLSPLSFLGNKPFGTVVKVFRAFLRENSSPLIDCRYHMYIYISYPPSASQLYSPACRKRNIRSFQALPHIPRLSASLSCRIYSTLRRAHLHFALLSPYSVV